MNQQKSNHQYRVTGISFNDSANLVYRIFFNHLTTAHEKKGEALSIRTLDDGSYAIATSLGLNALQRIYKEAIRMTKKPDELPDKTYHTGLTALRQSTIESTGRVSGESIDYKRLLTEAEDEVNRINGLYQIALAELERLSGEKSQRAHRKALDALRGQLHDERTARGNLEARLSKLWTIENSTSFPNAEIRLYSGREPKRFSDMADYYDLVELTMEDQKLTLAEVMQKRRSMIETLTGLESDIRILEGKSGSESDKRHYTTELNITRKRLEKVKAESEAFLPLRDYAPFELSPLIIEKPHHYEIVLPILPTETKRQFALDLMDYIHRQLVVYGKQRHSRTRVIAKSEWNGLVSFAIKKDPKEREGLLESFLTENQTDLRWYQMGIRLSLPHYNLHLRKEEPAGKYVAAERVRDRETLDKRASELFGDGIGFRDTAHIFPHSTSDARRDYLAVLWVIASGEFKQKDIIRHVTGVNDLGDLDRAREWRLRGVVSTLQKMDPPAIMRVKHNEYIINPRWIDTVKAEFGKT